MSSFLGFTGKAVSEEVTLSCDFGKYMIECYCVQAVSRVYRPANNRMLIRRGKKWSCLA